MITVALTNYKVPILGSKGLVIPDLGSGNEYRNRHRLAIHGDPNPCADLQLVTIIIL